jgi:endonuclease/exonuclease/phosphatase family metal-dependent hydrolase
MAGKRVDVVNRVQNCFSWGLLTRMICLGQCVLFQMFVSVEDVRAADDVRVMSFNVRYGTANDGKDAWPKRRELVVQTIRKFAPDLLGTQEMLPFQAEYIGQQLNSYQYIGWSRDESANGEQCGIFVRTERFEVLGSGQFWLSERPEEKFSKSWDSSLPRVATWVRVRDKSVGGSPFLFVNTHFDHRGEEARRQSALLLQERLPKIAEGQAIVMTGDFNCGEESDPYRELLQGHLFQDTYRKMEATRTDTEGTFHGFTGKPGAERIDWILVTGVWQVQSAMIDQTMESGRFPSDHFPVSAVLRRTADAGGK